jgi:pimeloyl-ACP methyl ester carboxylesterase
MKTFLAGMALTVSTAVAANAQVQTVAQQGCSTGVDKAFTKTLKAIAKDELICLKSIAKGLINSSCFTADSKGLIAKATTAAEAAQAPCNVPADSPSFGFAGAGTANEAALAGDELLNTVFGNDLVAALPPGNPDTALNKCQQSVFKAATKCRDARAKNYAKCKKGALKSGATSQAPVTACITDDSKGKIAKKCNLEDGAKVDGKRKAIAKKCAGVDLSVAFPGCGSTDAAILHQCIVPVEACATCAALGLIAGDNLGPDCDTYDNGASDSSCLAVGYEKLAVANDTEPPETPGTPGVVVTNPKLITQFGSPSIDLNTSLYTRWRAVGPEKQPDAIFIIVAGFGGDANNYLTIIEEMVPRVMADHGLLIEVWAFHRRSNQLEDREGSLLAIAAGDEIASLDWYFGDEMGISTPIISDGPGRRAQFYNSSDDVPFLANWTELVASRDIDAVVELARATAKNQNVFLGGHSAGTGFVSRYASTDFDLSGLGPAEPGYSKIRGLVLFEGGGGSTAGDPLTNDSLDRMIAKADGGLFGAVRDNAPRCVDGTTPCTIATEAADCTGQVPPVCTEPVTAYSAISGLGPEITAASEPGAIQAVTDNNSATSIAQQDLNGPGTSAVDLVPGLSILGILPPSTAWGLFGQFLDDDGLGASLSPALGTSVGYPGTGDPQTWRNTTALSLPSEATPDNGPAPTAAAPGIFGGPVWGQEKEVADMRRLARTFTAGESNAADWYYETSGYSVTSSPGRCAASVCTVGNVGASCGEDDDCAQAISLDSTALSVGRGRHDIANRTEAANIDIPVIAFGGSNGLTPLGSNYLPFAQSVATCAAPSCDGTPRVVDPMLPSEAFPTFGSISGGYEVYIREGLAHNDVVAAEDGPDSNIHGPLGDFIARNAQ